MPLICTPIQAPAQEKVIQKWKALRGKADLVELWLDDIKDLDLPSLLRQKPTPVLCRGKRALEAGKLGADYVDIPFTQSHSEAKSKNLPNNLVRSNLVKGGILRVAQNDIKVLRMTKGCKLILSYHNFKKTPSRPALLRLAKSMKKKGADIVKIAVQAGTFDDCLSVILLAQELRHLKIPHILIAMGKKGRLSRVLTPHVGGTIMFAPIKKSEATAPGQLTVKALRSAWKLIRINS